MLLTQTGEDPLDGKLDNDDIDSVAGLLKLYFRELKDPLFPAELFDQFVACSQKYNIYGLFDFSTLRTTFYFVINQNASTTLNKIQSYSIRHNLL